MYMSICAHTLCIYIYIYIARVTPNSPTNIVKFQRV